ncbi:MAG: phosphoglycerate kinase [Alphaproteobacteria bacterium]
MKPFYTLDDRDVQGKTVLVRLDLNVPMQGGKILDSTRIKASLGTLRELLGKNARVIILSHLGRPKSKTVPELTLAPIAQALSGHLGIPVPMNPEDNAWKIMMLENIRFHPGEESNDPEFASYLANMGDVYVNDAFSVSHRAHASVEALAKLLPACAGRLMEHEIAALSSALEKPKRPVMAIVGGSKVSTKLGVLENLVHKVDFLVPAGGIANTFLLDKHHDVGASLCEPDMLPLVDKILQEAEKAGCEIVLPTDVVVAEELKKGAPSRISHIDRIKLAESIFDIGPESIAAITAKMDVAETLVWNGPLGVFEISPFHEGTEQVAKAAASRNMFKIAGGGETVAAIAQAGCDSSFNHISTAGGAFLEWMEGKELPGVAVLKRQ